MLRSLKLHFTTQLTAQTDPKNILRRMNVLAGTLIFRPKTRLKLGGVSNSPECPPECPSECPPECPPHMHQEVCPAHRGSRCGPQAERRCPSHDGHGRGHLGARVYSGPGWGPLPCTAARPEGRDARLAGRPHKDKRRGHSLHDGAGARMVHSGTDAEAIQNLPMAQGEGCLSAGLPTPKALHRDGQASGARRFVRPHQRHHPAAKNDAHAIHGPPHAGLDLA